MPEVVSVVAGGWSVRNVDLQRIPGMIIGVNDAAVCLPACDVVVSMDRLWTEYRWPWLIEKKKTSHLRRSAVQNLSASAPWLHVFECDNETVEFSKTKNVLNGTNSGACALNLAYQIAPKRLYLFGFDMCRDSNGRAYWYDPYPWTTLAGKTSTKRYVEWADQFELIAQQFKDAGVEVINASPVSAIRSFTKTKRFEKQKCAS